MLLRFGFFGRQNFGSFLNERGLVGRAAEIGTHQGDFADDFLKSWRGTELICVDPWSNPPGYEDQAKHLWNSVSRDSDYNEATARLYSHIAAGRCFLFRSTSLEAARSSFLRDTLFDFVFVDGDHTPQATYDDLNVWWEKIRPGGLIAGHDIVMPHEPQPLWDPGIQSAAFQFCLEKGVDLWFVPEINCLPWSYYIEKPK